MGDTKFKSYVQIIESYVTQDTSPLLIGEIRFANEAERNRVNSLLKEMAMNPPKPKGGGCGGNSGSGGQA